MRTGDGVEVLAGRSPEPPAGVEGFVLEEVEMRGFMRYIAKTDPPLRFPGKFTVITGRTGAGKSSILDAITFALYGATARTDIQSVKIADVCRPGGFVRIAFRQGEARWEVRRGFTTKKESYLEIQKDGDAVQGTIHEKEQTIRDVVGLDYVGFRNSTFVRQEEMKELGSSRGADRLAVFQKLFRLEIFERALERAKELHGVALKDLVAKDAEIVAREESLEKLPAVREQLAAAKEELAVRGQRVEALEAEAHAAERALKGFEVQHEAWVRAKAAREECSTRIDRLGRREAELREQGRIAEELETGGKALEAEVEDLDALRAEWDGLKDRGQLRQQREAAADSARRLFDQAKGDHERRRDQIKDKMDRLYRKVAGLRTDVDRDAAFEALRDEGRLEERVVRIGREVEWLMDRPELVRTLMEEQGRAEKALERVHAKVQAIDQDSFVLTELQRQLEELKEELRLETEESHRTLAPLDEAKVEALRQLDGIPFTEADRRRLEDLAKLVPDRAEKRKLLDQVRAKLREMGDVAGLLTELVRNRVDLETERAAFQADLDALEAPEAAFQAGRTDLEQRRANVEGERKGLHILEGQAKQMADQVAGLEEEARRLEASMHQRAELRHRGELYDVLVNRVFHKKGVVMFAVDQLLPELEIEASRNLAELTDGRFSRIKLETYEEGRSHGIRIQVQGVDGLWHDVGEFSGGEKTQINAALRFAIAKALASLPQVGRTYGRMKTLFIDEGDLGSLDTEVSRELFVQKLWRMGEFFEKVILITHLAEVADRFPGRIRVTMTPDRESRADVLA